jgi:PhnB protein
MANAKKAAKKATTRVVNPVPRGYQTVTATMNQDDASATIAFCKKAFGATLRSKIKVPGGRYMHAELQIGDAIVMLSDSLMEPARQSCLFLYVPNVDKTIAKALKAGAKILAPVDNMFWGDRFARVTDPQGNIWELASRMEKVSPSELQKRTKLAIKQMVKAKK